jgi:hypothetical protein
MTTDLTNCTVGRYYLVPCVLITYWRTVGYHRKETPAWIPILGPPHSDPEFNVPARHYHYDPRFMSDTLIWSLRLGTDTILNQVLRMSVIEAGPTLRRRRCCRVMPVSRLSLESRKFMQRIEARYQDCQIDWQNPICPHRGFLLAGLPINPDGTITCPGHQLKWCATTGRLVSQVESA